MIETLEHDFMYMEHGFMGLIFAQEILKAADGGNIVDAYNTNRQVKNRGIPFFGSRKGRQREDTQSAQRDMANSQMLLKS
ncbi:MAG: hypothetical protein IPL13_14435 [Saprospiraceae bacterium]|nr:hypothetical protein [Candidatus Brachybacter algidus]